VWAARARGFRGGSEVLLSVLGILERKLKDIGRLTQPAANIRAARNEHQPSHRRLRLLGPRCGRKARLDERKLKIARYLFDRHGGKVMFSGAPDGSPRFIPLV
jgi:hypothetical protein